MKKLSFKGFTLVELLVVITILSILSVVAYQSFGWATDKAQNVTKKANLADVWSKLEIFNTEEHYYPMPQNSSSTNLWWYNSWAVADESNRITVVYSDQEIQSIVAWTALWWWRINWTWSISTDQIAAKWVLWQIGQFNKKYLKDKIYDTQLWDIKLTQNAWEKMIDYWIGKYVYAVYARAAPAANWNTSWTRWTYYTLAATFKDLDWEWYKTFLTWNYSKDNFATPADYPENLIWLYDGEDDKNVATTLTNQWIPYPIDNFAK